MIYDCFTFYNEVELLILRLELLHKKIDKFIIVEASKTFTGIPKPYNLEQNWDRLKKFHHKILYIKIDDFPSMENPWICENYQRNMISCGLNDCKDHDLIMISDLDEIPDSQKIPKSVPDGIVKCFLQDNYYYFANNYISRNIVWEGGTKILNYKTFSQNLLSEKYVKYNEITFPQSLNAGNTPMKIRLYRNLDYIRDGGWHFGWLGGVDFIMNKLQSFSHQEHNNQYINNREYITNCLATGKDLLDARNKCYVIDRSNFPEDIIRLMPPQFFLDSKRRLNIFGYKFLKFKQISFIYTRNYLRKFFG